MSIHQLLDMSNNRWIEHQEKLSSNICRKYTIQIQNAYDSHFILELLQFQSPLLISTTLFSLFVLDWTYIASKMCHSRIRVSVFFKLVHRQAKFFKLVVNQEIRHKGKLYSQFTKRKCLLRQTTIRNFLQKMSKVHCTRSKIQKVIFKEGLPRLIKLLTRCGFVYK